MLPDPVTAAANLRRAHLIRSDEDRVRAIIDGPTRPRPGSPH